MFPTGTVKLYWLMDLYASGQTDTMTFCREFERTYNFEVKKTTLSPDELSAFEEIFRTVTVYSPFPEELEAVPMYKSAEQVDAVVKAAQSRLEPKNSN